MDVVLLNNVVSERLQQPQEIQLKAVNVNHGVAQWEEDDDHLELDCSPESPSLSSRRSGS
jgi:hypothetical protein